MSSDIYILSDAIQSGKTSLLELFIKKHKNVAGILAPTINDLRKILNLKDKVIYDFEKIESDCDDDDDVLVGKFTFSGIGFKKARKVLIDSLDLENYFLIVDEIGKLELVNKGLEPELSYVLEHSKATLILVIRDYLLADCILKYKLHNAKVLNLKEFKKHFNL